jgi:hypothetical protein
MIRLQAGELACDNNAMNLAAAGADPAELGLVILQPGESRSAQLVIEVERMP